MFEETETYSTLLFDADLSVHTACRLGNLSLISKAISNNPSCINNKDPALKWTPLFRCVISGHLKAVELLLESGANPDIGNDSAETPLHQAIENSNQKMY